MTRALLALLLIVGHLPVAEAAKRRAAQHPSAPIAPAAIVTAARQAAEAAMAAGVPAVQIAVTHRGSVIYAEAFGVTDQESATVTTPRSVLQIGSVTKQFTAAAILRLAERGTLTLDDRIEKYVPEFNPRGATITLRHLLSHTSGVRRDWYLPTPSGLAPPAAVTREQTIATLNSQLFDFPPGTKWGYSNAGYLLLGYAIESITGRPYADFIRTEFVLPLGLLDTGVCGTSNLPLPGGYGLQGTWKRMQPLDPSVMLSAGAICTTASDLARWAHLLATGGVMLPDSYAAMTTAARLQNGTVVPSSYAFGVAVQNMLGQPAVWHSGAIDGFQSFLLYLPGEDVAVAVVTNAFPAPPGGNPQNIVTAVASAALGSL